MTSHHTTAPGSSTTSQPVCAADSQTPNTAPAGSTTIAMLPKSMIGIAGTISVPPASATAATVAARSSVAR